MSEAALAGLEPAEVQLATWLASDGGQSHLLTGWEEAAVEDKRRLLAQVTDIVEKYTPVRVRARLRPLTSLCSYTSTETRCSRIPRPKLTILQVAEMDAKYPSDAQGRRGLSAYAAPQPDPHAFTTPSSVGTQQLTLIPQPSALSPHPSALTPHPSPLNLTPQ